MGITITGSDSDTRPTSLDTRITVPRSGHSRVGGITSIWYGSLLYLDLVLTSTPYPPLEFPTTRGKVLVNIPFFEHPVPL